MLFELKMALFYINGKISIVKLNSIIRENHIFFIIDWNIDTSNWQVEALSEVFCSKYYFMYEF